MNIESNESNEPNESNESNEQNKPIQNVDSKIGLCGFRNIGNTCYMNSILQLLIHSKLIVNFLLSKSNPFVCENPESKIELELELESELNYDGEFMDCLKESSLSKIGEKERKRLKLSELDDIIVNKSEVLNYIDNSLTIKLAEIINTIIYKGNSCITPNIFKHIIDRKIPTLRGMGQQDSHELLNGIFDNLIEETGMDSEPIINNVPQIIKDYVDFLQEIKKRIRSTNEINERKLIVQELNEFKKKNNDVINKFNGLDYMIKVFKNKRTNVLDTSSTGHNPMIFNLLTFVVDTFTCIECKFSSCKYQYNTNLMLHIKPTLNECFDQMIEEELIDRKCEICNCAKATKKTKLWRPGMTLFIELCRFSSLPNGRLWKNNTNVEIPHELDIAKYCDSSMVTETALTYKYKLKGISNHMGNMNGGHYTADCVSITDNNTWYHFDDSRVLKHSNDNIDTTSAYILLYEME